MSFAFDPGKLSDGELERLIAWLRAHGHAQDPRYDAAAAERIRRQGRGMTIGNTLDLVRSGARAAPERFVTYGELWALTGTAWGLRAMGEVNRHLGLICDWARSRGLPMFSAWFVPARAARTGELDGSSLKGFVECAVSLGLDPGATEAEQRAFLDRQRDDVRRWAALPA